MAPSRRRIPVRPKKRAVRTTPRIVDDPVELRRRAEARVIDRRGDPKSDASARRVFHELEVHQIELEMQNAELHRARNELEQSLERYTDLYDFAPIGYCSLDDSGVILAANLTGAALLGVGRSRLIGRSILPFVSPTSRSNFLAELGRVFTDPDGHSWEVPLLSEGGGSFWASFRASAAAGPPEPRASCRVAFGDISARKEAEEAQHRLEILAHSNRELVREISRRKKVEKALQKSELHQRKLLEEAHGLQRQLRQLSHRTLRAQEEERKRISRELHDEIAQTLVGITAQLAALSRETRGDPNALKAKIARTQRLVEKSVEIVHRFARELRPATLDDLGLVPALHIFMKELTKRTGLLIRFKTFTGGKIAHLDSDTRTALYRVAQEALLNVARHAEASVVTVSLEKLPGSLRITIRDDGKSFRVRRVLHGKRNTRLGLIGMRERMEMVGGSFGIESARGKGTTIVATAPHGKPDEA